MIQQQQQLVSGPVGATSSTTGKTEMPPRRNRARGKFSRTVPAQNGREQCQAIACHAQLYRRAPPPPTSKVHRVLSAACYHNDNDGCTL